MPVLYALEQGAGLHLHGDCVEIRRDGATAVSAQLSEIERIACFGRISITPALFGALLTRGTPVSLHTLSGRCRGHVLPADDRSAMLRAAQWRIALDPAAALPVARTLVASKIDGALYLLRAYRHGLAGRCKAVRKFQRARAELTRAGSFDALRGHEGAATRSYYGYFRRLLPPQWPFPGRHYHPPLGPVNALLSFTYGLVRAEIAGELAALGFDPAAGFLHGPCDKRPSLALDLLELFRHPVADHLVLTLIRRGQVALDAFESDDEESKGVVRLGDKARRAVLAAYETFVTAPRVPLPGGAESYRAVFRREAQRLAASVGKGHPYEAISWT